jgi:hypothetical protein
MTKVPVFVEVPAPGGKPEAQVCQVARTILEGMGYELAPMAHSAEGLTSQLGVLKQSGMEPGIYVINTFGAREIIKELDAIIGETPVLFLRRNLYAGQSGLSEHFNIAGNSESTMSVIQHMSVRLLAVWNYGGLNAGEIARNCARCVDQFLKKGDFRVIELQSQGSIRTRP